MITSRMSSLLDEIVRGVWRKKFCFDLKEAWLKSNENNMRLVLVVLLYFVGLVERLIFFEEAICPFINILTTRSLFYNGPLILASPCARKITSFRLKRHLLH
jgi:hypothetical protein